MEFKKPQSVLAVFFVGMSITFTIISMSEFGKGRISDGAFSTAIAVIDALLAWMYWDGIKD